MTMKGLYCKKSKNYMGWGMIEILCCIIGFLLLFIVFQQIISYKERDLLMNKVMAKSFVDYANVELAKAEISKKKGENSTAIKF